MNTAFLILVVGGVIAIVLYLLVRPAKGDKYNEAAKLYRNLRYLPEQGRMSEYNEYLIKIIKLCQLAILENPRNGDAHVLLGNAFILASPRLSEDDYFTKLAVAVLYEQELKGYSTRVSKGNSAILMEGIIQSAPQIVKQLPELHHKYLLEALNPRKLSYSKELLGVT